MAERSTAEGQLARVLEILPRAAREGGVAIAELSAALDASPGELLRDLEEVYTRAYYHPAGSGEEVQVLIDADQVEVWTTGEFRRPLRLNAREAFALGLGLRVLAAGAPAGARGELEALAGRLERALAAPVDRASAPALAVSPGSAPDGVRALLADAARERRRCEIGYLKPGAAAAEPRTVDPYVLMASAGRWYLVGHCHRAGDTRVFRADRVASVAPLEERFEPPDDFDPGRYVSEGRVYRAGEHVEATVRYAPAIARWIEEQGPVETLEDGSVLVRYRVSDPHWLVSHVLTHAPEAEVVGPPEMRAAVREALTRMIG